MTEIKGRIGTPNGLRGQLGGSGGGGSDNYPDLKNKPKINGHTLLNDQTPADLEMKLSQLENDEGFVKFSIIAAAYDETLTYQVGDYAIYENTLYMCITEITTAEEWNPEKWSAVRVTEIIPAKTSELQNDSNYVTNDEVESQIDELLPVDSASGSVASFSSALGRPLISLEAEIDYQAGGVSEVNIYQLGSNFFDKSTVTTGKLINGGGNEVSYAGWNVSDFIPVIEGASYYLYGLSNHPNTNQDNFELFDSNKTKTGFANVKTYDQPYVIPAGVKFIKFSLADGDMNTAQFGVSKNTIYEAYNALINKKTIDVSEYSVYGGYIDLTPTQATLLSTKNPDGTDKETPEVYPLEGVTDFNSQVGTNNILADSGDVSVTFKDSIQHYIDKKIAETQALIL